MLLLSSADFFQNYLFKKLFQKHYIRVSNSLHLNQDLGPNCLQRISAELARKELKKEDSHSKIAIFIYKSRSLRQGFYLLERYIYLNVKGFLEKSLKIKSSFFSSCKITLRP